MKLCIDLGYGYGGASAAFKDAGWEVIGLDIDRKFRPTIQGSYSHLPFRTDLCPDMILAAPECRCFSVGSISTHWNPDRTPKDEQTKVAITNTLAMKEEIQRLAPHFGIIENPVCMMRHILGPPDHTIRQSDFGRPYKKPTDLWEVGSERIPFKMLAESHSWEKAPRGSKHGVQQSRWRKRSAEWPYALSKHILEAIESA